MTAWTIWIIAAAVLLIIEVMTQMMWALCLAIGAFAAFICALAGLDITWQVVALGAGSVIGYILLLPWFKRRYMKAHDHQARTGMDALLGRRAVVTEAIRPGHLGRARIDGDNWQVTAPDVDHEIKAGSEVVVTAYDSIILTVALL